MEENTYENPKAHSHFDFDRCCDTRNSHPGHPVKVDHHAQRLLKSDMDQNRQQMWKNCIWETEFATRAGPAKSDLKSMGSHFAFANI